MNYDEMLDASSNLAFSRLTSLYDELSLFIKSTMEDDNGSREAFWSVILFLIFCQIESMLNEYESKSEALELRRKFIKEFDDILRKKIKQGGLK